MSKEEKYQLEDLEIGEVSLVPKGAIRKKFYLMKGEEMSPEEIFKSILEVDLENEHTIDEMLQKASASPEAMAAVKNAMRMLQSFKDELPPGIMMSLARIAGEKVEEKTETKKEEIEKEAEMSEENKEVKKEEIPEEFKAKFEELFKANEEAAKKAEELQKELDAERDARLTKEYQEKVSAYNVAGISNDDLATLVKSADALLPEEQAKALKTMLEATTNVVNEGALFTKVGKTNSEPAPSDTDSKIEKLVKELMEKDSSLTKEKAEMKVLENNEELFNDIMNR